MRIRFTTDVNYDGGGHKADAYSYKAGDVADLPDASAMHWLNRGKAEFAGDDDKGKPPTEDKGGDGKVSNKGAPGKAQNKGKPPTEDKGGDDADDKGGDGAEKSRAK